MTKIAITKKDFTSNNIRPLISSPFYNQIVSILFTLVKINPAGNPIYSNLKKYKETNLFDFDCTQIYKDNLEFGLRILEFLETVACRDTREYEIGLIEKNNDLEFFLYNKDINVILFTLKLEYYKGLIWDVKIEKYVLKPIYSISGNIDLDIVLFNKENFCVVKENDNTSTFLIFGDDEREQFKFERKTSFFFKPSINLKDLPLGSWIELPVIEEIKNYIQQIEKEDKNQKKNRGLYKLIEWEYLGELKVSFIYRYRQFGTRLLEQHFESSGIFDIQNKSFLMSRDSILIKEINYK